MPIPQLDTQTLPKLLEVMAGLTQQEFLLLSSEGRIEYATPNTGCLFNRQGKELAGTDLAELLGAELSRKLLKDAQERQDWLIIEHRIPQPGNQPLNAQLSFLPYENQLNQTRGGLLALSPLGAPEGKDRFTSMGELTASMAHEIRNPLAGILTTAETLREDFDPQDARREYLERIITEINRVNLFLVKFLALARPQKPQFALASLPEVLDHVLFLEKKEIERRQIQVVREYELRPPKILIDTHQIQQVFLNLILNAIQAMPQGGVLGLKVDSSQKAGDKPRSTQVEISDNGSGIAPRNLKEIFTPFFTTKPKGVGLGLSVSQQILKEHQGQLKVRSKLGEGTTFTLILPMQRKQPLK